jgi:hypothetical protein
MVNQARVLAVCAAIAATAVIVAPGAYLFSLGWDWVNTYDVKPTALGFFVFLMVGCAVSAIAVARITHRAVSTA